MKKNIVRKRWAEMYAYLIGTIVGLLIIGAMFYAYYTTWGNVWVVKDTVGFILGK